MTVLDAHDKPRVASVVLARLLRHSPRPTQYAARIPRDQALTARTLCLHNALALAYAEVACRLGDAARMRLFAPTGAQAETACEALLNGPELIVRPEGQLAFNTITLHLDTALAGLGLAYLPEDVVKDHLAEGRLVRVLADWSAQMSGLILVLPESPPADSSIFPARQCVALSRASVMRYPNCSRCQLKKLPHRMI